MLDLKPYREFLSKSGAPVVMTATESDALIHEIEELRTVLAICLPLAREVVDMANQQLIANDDDTSRLDQLVHCIQRGNKLIERDGEMPVRLISGTVKMVDE